MGGHAQVDPAQFDFLIDEARYDYDLFCPPNPAIGTAEHAIGLYVSSLVRDGGTLQVGIGELGEALMYALLLRHQQNDAWRGALEALGRQSAAAVIRDCGGEQPFAAGLYAASEMFVAQLLELYRAGILRRRVYDCLPLERLVSDGHNGRRLDEQALALLAAAGAGPRLDAAQFATLQHYGVFRQDVEFADGSVRAPGGSWIPADLADPASRALLARECLGSELRNGQVLHAGFFLGPRGFYAALRELPESERAQLGMRGVEFVNQLYGADQELRILQRRAARCVNTCMMVTLLGAAVSDALESGRVVSGVGGQYNFVAMAHALPGGRSILCLRATRTRHGRTTSNILWSYGHETIPRHLRDIVVTEYGVADLRGRTDEEVIAALLNIADSRFQDALLARAREAGKIRADYRIPDAFRNNLPGRLRGALAAHRARGYFSEYPFGTDLTAEETALARALQSLEARSASRWARITMLLAAVTRGGHAPCTPRRCSAWHCSSRAALPSGCSSGWWCSGWTLRSSGASARRRRAAFAVAPREGRRDAGRALLADFLRDVAFFAARRGAARVALRVLAALAFRLGASLAGRGALRLRGSRGGSRRRHALRAAQLIENRGILQRRDVLGDLLAARDRLAAAAA